MSDKQITPMFNCAADVKQAWQVQGAGPIMRAERRGMQEPNDVPKLTYQMPLPFHRQDYVKENAAQLSCTSR
jgi:hypothetical protein